MVVQGVGLTRDLCTYFAQCVTGGGGEQTATELKYGTSMV